MFFKFLILSSLLSLFGMLAFIFLKQLYRYGSIGNIIKSDKLQIGSYWLPKGVSPFEDTLAIRINDIKANYIRYEVSPGEFSSMPMKAFLFSFQSVKEKHYQYPNNYEIWEEKTPNPFDEKSRVKILELDAGWVKFEKENEKVQSIQTKDFIAKYSFKDFADYSEQKTLDKTAS